MWNWKNFESKIILVIAVISILILYNYVIPDSFYDWRVPVECRTEQEMKNKEFTGLVKDKYLDTNNHSIQTIEISNNLIEIVNENSGFFERVEIGDSLSKESESLKVDIARNDSSFTISLDYNCQK